MAATLSDFLASNGDYGSVYNTLAANLDKRGTREESKLARGGVDPSVWVWFDQQTASRGGSVEAAVKQIDNAAQAANPPDPNNPHNYVINPTNDAGQIAYEQRLANMPTTISPNNGASSTIQPPTTTLQPGATGEAVKQLQDYLVSKGLMTQAEVDTGYGTYGPKTTAAVQKLQTQLGVDNSSGPGYWGPKTISATTSSSSSPTVPNSPISAGAPTSVTTTPTTASTPTVHDTTVQNIINNSGLTSDQKTIAQQLFDIVSANDNATAERLKSAFNAATEFSNPYFKAQVLVATDALSRALGANEGDLSYQETKLANTLKDLTANTTASKDYLDFQKSQDLQKLARSYEKDLEDTRQNLASVGKTSSSVRSRAEQLLSEENQGLVESTNKQFAYQTGNLDRGLTSGIRDNSLSLSYLKDKATQARIDALRKTEGQVGTSNLQGLGYTDLLGNIGGEIPRQQVLDANSFASSFVF